MHFDHLGLRAALLHAVHEKGYNFPTPVQAHTIPAILSGRDLMVAAGVSTGKTTAFALPVLQRLMGVRRGSSRATRALIMVATRKHASHVAGSVRNYGVHLPLRCTAIFGGVGMQPQVDLMRLGADIVVATPGCLVENARNGSIDFREIEILVLDEVDRMLDRGFIHDIRWLLPLMSARRQSILFSATFPDEVHALASRMLGRSERVQVGHFNHMSQRRTSSTVAWIRDSGSDSRPWSRTIASGSWC